MSRKVVAFACAVALGLFLIVPVSNLLHYLLGGLGPAGLWVASLLSIIVPIGVAYLAYRKLA